ncbi:MAG: hypothetical protein QNK22_01515, partial [Xanthomonadales bacterium]|nr:hypothetical protein [Xanthomonadales bacterium]
MESEYTVPVGSENPLVDQGNLIVQDACNIEPLGCSTQDQNLQFGAAVSLFVPSIDVSKTGPAVAKVGDEITYTIGFTDTTTGVGFPGFENCTGNDPLLGGDLGPFTAGVTRDFTYTVKVGDPDPLLNTATIDCIVKDFDNEVANSDSHSVGLIAPSINVTKTGPATAKVGDEITYTIGFTDTSVGGTLGACIGNDPLLGGNLGPFTAGVTRDFPYTVQGGDSNPLLNTATITCDVVGFDNKASDDDDHSVNLIDPSIEVTKTGPVIAKVGDEITYTIGFTDTSISGTLGVCTGSDALLGGDLGVFTAGVTRDFPYTVQVGDPDPLLNTATIICDVVGFDNKASDNDGHSVDLIDPSIDVTKTGPVIAKVGDEITYTIGFTNTGIGALGVCTGEDTVLGPLGVFLPGVPRDFLYTVRVGDPNPLPNTATITCDVEGFDNKASDNDSHSVNLIDPSIEVTKTGPATAKVGDEITYTIGFTDTTTGVGFPGFENCTGNDPLLGGDLGVFSEGVTRDFTYTVKVDDPDPLPNTATITCEVGNFGEVSFDNIVANSDSHNVDLIAPSIEVTKTGPATAKVGDEITYTIGFADTGIGALGVCTGSDPLLGGDLGVFTAGVPRDFTYTVQVGDPDPLLNTATIICDVEGFDNKARGSDGHSVDLIAPSIEVTKTGPATAKVGDEITYTIGFADTGIGALGVCTGSDPLLGGDLGVFTAGVPRDFLYTVQVGDPDPLLNTATIICDVEGFDNKARGSDGHSVDLIAPSIEVTKTGPATAKVGDEITYTIGFADTGIGALGVCTGSDPLLG